MTKKSNSKAELKFFDVGPNGVSFTASDVNTNAVCKHLNGIAGGSGTNTRVGNKYRVKSIDVRFRIKPHVNAADDEHANVRIVLLWDKHPKETTAGSALPSMADIFTSSVGGEPWSHVSMNNRHRFRILRDEIYDVGVFENGGIAGTHQGVSSGVMPHGRFYVRFPGEGAEVVCNGATAALSDIATGSIILCAFSQNASAAAPNVAFHSRIRYLDK